MLGPDEMAEYEEARAAAETAPAASAIAFAWFSLWLAMIAAAAEGRTSR